MAGTRRVADDRSNMNVLYKPIGYFTNAAKETGQYAKAVVKDILDADKAKNTPRMTPKGVVMGVKAKDNNAKAEFGQAVGAIVKGARYDSKGKRR
jgi:hypothetical protein